MHHTKPKFSNIHHEYQQLLASYQQLQEHNQNLMQSLTIRDTEGNSYTQNDLIKYLDQANEQINELKTELSKLQKENKLYKSFQNLCECDSKLSHIQHLYKLTPEIIAQAPLYFRCALTNQVMSEPVVDKDGYSYEKSSIIDWLKLSQTSPITSSALSIEDLRSNFALKSAITNWCKQKLGSTPEETDDQDDDSEIGPINTDGSALVHMECNENIPALKNFIAFDQNGLDLSDIKWKARVKDEIHRDIINVVHTSSGLAKKIKKMSPGINEKSLDYLQQVNVILKELFAHMIQKQSIISVYQKLRKCFVIFCKIPEQKSNSPKDRVFTMIKLYSDFMLTEAIKKMTFQKNSQPTNFTQVIDKARTQLLEMAIDEKTNQPRNAEVTIIGCDIPIRLILIVNGLHYIPPKKSLGK